MSTKIYSKNLVICLSLLFLVLMTPQPLRANHGSGHKGCSTCSHGSSGGSWEMDDAIFHKAHFMLENQEALGLSQTQVNDIETLKTNVQKMMIRQDAEIDVLKLDIKSKMFDYPVDGKALETLVTQKYDLKKEKAMQLAQAYTQLKNSLSQEQYQKMKELWKAQSVS